MGAGMEKPLSNRLRIRESGKGTSFRFISGFSKPRGSASHQMHMELSKRICSHSRSVNACTFGCSVLCNAARQQRPCSKGVTDRARPT
eukprot:12264349-Alexandrium_andersonii.AAC.1